MEKEFEIPPFHPDDVAMLFGVIDMPVGLILKHNDPSVCFCYLPVMNLSLKFLVWLGPQIKLQELLLIKPVTYSDSLAS